MRFADYAEPVAQFVGVGVCGGGRETGGATEVGGHCCFHRKRWVPYGAGALPLALLADHAQFWNDSRPRNGVLAVALRSDTAKGARSRCCSDLPRRIDGQPE